MNKYILIIVTILLIVVIIIYFNKDSSDYIKSGENREDITEDRIIRIILNMNASCTEKGITPDNCKKITPLFRKCIYEWGDRMSPDVCAPAITFYLICESTGETNCEKKYLYPYDAPDGYIFIQQKNQPL